MLVYSLQGGVDCAYYQGKIIPTQNENVTLYQRLRDNQRKLQFSDSINNYELNLFHIDYDITERLFHYGKNSYNLRFSDCNTDSPFTQFEDINLVFKKDSPYEADVIPNNRKLLSVKFAMEKENAMNYRP